MRSESLTIEPIYLTIKDWPEGERPREKLFTHGPKPLGDAELLAILIGSGTRGATALDLGQTLLHQSDGLSGIARLTPEMLCRLKGVGQASAARIAAAVEIGRRLASGDRKLASSIWGRMASPLTGIAGASPLAMAACRVPVRE